MDSTAIVNEVHNVFEESGLILTAAQASAIADALIAIVQKRAAAGK